MKTADRISIRVPEELLRITTKCPHAFSCLVTGCCGSRPVCPVLAANGDGELYLNTREDFACPYLVRRGPHRICSCPMYYAMRRFIRR